MFIDLHVKRVAVLMNRLFVCPYDNTTAVHKVGFSSYPTQAPVYSQLSYGRLFSMIRI